MNSLKLTCLLFPLVLALAGACSPTTRDFGDEGSGAAAGSVTTNGGSATAQAGSKPTAEGGSDSAGSGAGPSGPGGEGGGGGDGGDGGAPECFTGQQVDCWELEDGTAIEGPILVDGSCHVGQRFCDEDGRWGACLGAAGPKSKDACDVAGNDDDCDGKPNGGCECVSGSMRPCGTDVGSCVRGEQTCTGEVWGACVGEVAPQALDSCLVEGNDDNCDGKANDGCPCIGEEAEACGECGTRQCNAAGRQWGTCQPAASVCASSTKVKDCSEQGAWVESSCQHACVDGQCTGSCTPGQGRCVSGPERRQLCSDQGIWTTVETCSGIQQCKNNGASCVEPCAGQKLCPGSVCVPSGGCCSDAECGGGFACVNGTCSTTTCQPGFKGPCGGVCTTGCCSVNDCGERSNMSRSCNANHQCVYACKFNYGNCDGNDGNGCEVSLISGTPSGFTVSHCGECGNTCDFTNGESGGVECYTRANSCAFAECYATFAPIGDPTDEYAYECPVERPYATLFRGDCNIGCTYYCDPGRKDCNYSASDGCETLNANADENCNADPFWAGSYL